MQPRTSLLSTVVLSATTCLGSSAMAAETPRSGSDTFTGYNIVSARNSLRMDTTEFATYEINGIQSSNNEMFDHMGLRCLGEVMGSGDAAHRRGACTLMANNGDQFFTTYEGVGANNQFVVTGGTGRFKGMTGTGEASATGVQGPDGHFGAVVVNKRQWQIQ